MLYGERAWSMLRVNEGGPEESKRLVIPGQEACHMVGPGGWAGGCLGTDMEQRRGFTSKASVFSVKWDVTFSVKSQGEKGYGGLAEG